MTQPIQSVNQTVYLIWLFPATFIRLQLFFSRNIEEKEKNSFQMLFRSNCSASGAAAAVKCFSSLSSFFRFIFRGRIRNT